MDGMDHEGDILDGPSGGPEELRAIVYRVGRHQRRYLAVAAAAAAGAALVAGAGIGYAISNHGAHPDKVVAVAGPATSTPRSGSAPNAGPSIGGGASVNGTLTLVFTRTAGTIQIRGYQPPTPAAGAGGCPIVPLRFQAEVSTARVAGVATAVTMDARSSSTTTPAIASMSAQRLGQSEGAPVDVVIVHTSVAVTDVSAQFTDGAAATDQMAPVEGWSVLVATPPLTSGGSAPAGSGQPVTVASVTARGPGGQVLDQQTAELNGAVALPQVNGAVAGPVACLCGTPGAVS